MTEKSIVLYPRGFLGFDIGLAAHDPSCGLDQIVQAIKFNKPVPKPDLLVSNHDVDALYKEFMTGEKYVTQFGFREKILVAALRAFGTQDFLEWAQVQERSPYFTDMHRRFLNDTFEFIVTGHRAMNVITWQSLVQYDEATHKDRETRLEYQALFNTGGNANSQPRLASTNRAYPNTDLASVLHFWVAKPGGFEDLISTLQILFGSVQYNKR